MKKLIRRFLSTPLEVLALSSLALPTAMAQTPYTPDNSAAGAFDARQTTYLSGQAWLPEVRERFYFTPQGSKIIPYDWAMALTTPDGARPFFSSNNLSRYGYIPQKASPMNADALPVGFMKDDNPAGFTRVDKFAGKVPNFASMPQLGMNCAACHTSELSYKGLKLRIDGGPSYTNFQMFTKDMDEAIGKVAFDNEQGGANYDSFMSFADRLNTRTQNKGLSSLSATEKTRLLGSLRAQLAEFGKTRQKWQNSNGLKTAGIVYGPARNDAFGAIFNQVLADFLNRPDNVRPANAPVKYPMIWDAPYHDVVQWVGIARNSPAAGGPISRNIGQVLGVFGHSDVNAESMIKGYCTSSKRANLNALEDWVRDLRSPTWPKDIFGFDAEKAKRGQVHYQKYCIGCHQLNERSPQEAQAHMQALGITGFNVYKALSVPDRKANERMISIDGADGVHTDPLTAENAYSRSANTGPLLGRKLQVLSGRPMEEVEPGASVLRHVVAGSILGSFSYLTCAATPRDGNANLGLARKMMSKVLGFTKEDTDPPNFAARMTAFKDALSKYKARPLNGVWAAPPYLHNGSVRSLKQLLTKAEQREKGFDLNCNEYDPNELGLNCAPGTVNASNVVYAGNFRFETEGIRGNSNQGHEFGTDLTDVQKMELIEYIKAL